MREQAHSRRPRDSPGSLLHWPMLTMTSNKATCIYCREPSRRKGGKRGRQSPSCCPSPIPSTGRRSAVSPLRHSRMLTNGPVISIRPSIGMRNSPAPWDCSLFGSLNSGGHPLATNWQPTISGKDIRIRHSKHSRPCSICGRTGIQIFPCEEPLCSYVLKPDTDLKRHRPQKKWRFHYRKRHWDLKLVTTAAS